MVALCVSSCSVSRQVTRESRDRVATYETRDSCVDERVVVMDTVKEVTTVTVQLGAAGDTVFRSVVTDRSRGRNRDAIAVQRTKVEIKRDTVVVEKRDSVFIKNTNLANPTNKASPVVSSLKWIFWIIVAVIALMIVVRIRGRP
ncbi:MAG: hypothetical protein J5953_15760 [Prevotella sp.]|nr:hypothetical protein [Prevotella sp.]